MSMLYDLNILSYNVFVQRGLNQLFLLFLKGRNARKKRIETKVIVLRVHGISNSVIVEIPGII